MTDHDLPLVSVVIACRNEARSIRECVGTLLTNGYPLDRLEIIFADGESDDGTPEMIREASAGAPGVVRVINNPLRVMPSGANLGIQASHGDVIFILNGHTTYRPGYLETCVRALDTYGVDAVGGKLDFVADTSALFGPAIAMVFGHPFGVGGARYRTEATQPREVDTPGFAGFKRVVFERAGLFDESLKHSQDYELYRRIGALGFRMMIQPAARAVYRPRSSYSGFAKYAWRNGEWISVPMRLAGVRFARRHFVPAAAAALGIVLAVGGIAWQPAWLALGALTGAYATIATAASLVAGVRQRSLRIAVTGPPTFLTLHALMGLGTLWGLVRPLHAERAVRSAVGPPATLPPHAGHSAK